MLKLLLFIATLALVQDCQVASALRGIKAEPAAPENPFIFSPCYNKTAEQCLALMNLDNKIGQLIQVANVFLTNVSDLGLLSIGSLLSGGGNGPAGEGGTAPEWAEMTDAYQMEALKSDLKIPLIYAVDAVHGHNNVYGATIFPHNIGLGATGDPALVNKIGEATRKEMLATGVQWTFAPCVAVPRDDRWGRTYEGFSENKTLVSLLGEQAVIGLQNGNTGVRDQNAVLASAKHYLGDGGATWGTGGWGYPIDQGDISAAEQLIRDIHLFPYKAAIEAGVGSMVVSYSSIYKIKMHGNGYWLTDVLKGELGFKGFLISDWGGVDQIDPDYAVAVRNSINAGMDMVMVPKDYLNFFGTLKGEVQAGRVNVSRIDDAVLRILRAKYALKLWDYPFAHRELLNTVGSKEHRDLARDAVAKSMVLLQNDARPADFPLPTTGNYSIAVAGKSADNIGIQCGGWTISWAGAPGATTVGTTVLQGIRDAVANSSGIEVAQVDVFSSFNADVGIAVVGELPYAEGVGDSATLAPAGEDLDVIYNLCEKVTTCIVIIISGRPLIITDHLPTASIWIAGWLPGTEGAGIADVLFGLKPFTGKLPVTWPVAVAQEPANQDDGTDFDALFTLGYGLTAGTQVPLDAGEASPPISPPIQPEEGTVAGPAPGSSNAPGSSSWKRRMALPASLLPVVTVLLAL